MSFFRESDQELESQRSLPVVPLRVTAFDVRSMTTTGINERTQETMTIRLRPLGERAGARIDVDTWAKPRTRMAGNVAVIQNPKGVAVTDAGRSERGGIIVFDGVYHSEADGCFLARWGTVAAHTGDEAELLTGWMRPVAHHVKGAGQVLDSNGAVDWALKDRAILIRSREEMLTKFSALRQRYRINNAIIRASDGDECRAADVWSQHKQSTGEALDRFYRDDIKLGRLLSDKAFSSGALTVELIPVVRLYPGAQYKNALLGAGTEHKRFVRDWRTGPEHFGFGLSFAAVRRHPEGGRMLTLIRPSEDRMMMYATAADLPTPHIDPMRALVRRMEPNSTTADVPQAREPARSPSQRSAWRPHAANDSSGHQPKEPQRTAFGTGRR